MNLYTQQETNEDQILDNYMALWREVIGDKKLVVRGKRPTSNPMGEFWRNEIRTCGCGVKFKPTWFYKQCCGSVKEKTGCAYKNYREGIKKSLATNYGKRYE